MVAHRRSAPLPTLHSGPVQIIPLFASEDKKNRVILDYMPPCRLVRDERRNIPRGVWQIINRTCNPDGTVTYSPDAMEQTLTRAGCSHIVQHPMHNIELHRTGMNRYFPAVFDGWIQIAAGRL
jgi:hypothetical protein